MFKPQLFIALVGILLLMAFVAYLGVIYVEATAPCFTAFGMLFGSVNYAIKKLSGGKPE